MIPYSSPNYKNNMEIPQTTKTFKYNYSHLCEPYEKYEFFEQNDL